MKEIGTVISTLQGPNSSEFSFVINEDSQKIPVRKNEYVQLKTEQGLMIARVAEIYRMNRYYMRAESVREYERSGRDLSEMFPADKWEFLVASAIPLGIFEDGKQLRVSFPPSPGEKVYRADEKILFEFLGLDEKGLAIGKMEAHDLEVKLNLTKLFQKHLAILAISGAGKCLNPNSNIIFKNELQPIEKIAKEFFTKNEVESDGDIEYCKVNEKTLTTKDFKIEEGTIKAITRRKSPEKMIRIKTWSGKEIELTPEHPLLTWKDGPVWEEAKKLKKNSYIAVPSKLSLKCRLQEVNLAKELKEEKEFYAVGIKAQLYKLKEKSGLSWKMLAKKIDTPYATLLDWKNTGKVPLYKLNMLEKIENDKIFDKIEKISHRSSPPIKNKIKIDKDFARFLGYLFAEGYNGKSYLTFTNSQKIILDDFYKLCIKVGKRPVKIKKGEYRIFWKTLSQVMYKVFGIKSSARKKIIPNIILKSPNSIISHFLRSIFDCDGHCNNSKPEIEFVFSNKENSKRLDFLLLRFGIISKVKERKIKTKSGEKRYWYLYVRGVENLKKYAKIGFSIPYKKERLLKHFSLSANTNVDVIPSIPLLKNVLKELNMSYSELGRRASLSQAHISNYLSKKCGVSKKVMKKITNILKKRIEEIQLAKERIDKVKNMFPQMNLKDTLEIVRRIQNESGIFYKDIAQNCNISPTTVGRMLSGRTSVTDNVYEIARALVNNFKIFSKEEIREEINEIRKTLFLGCKKLDMLSELYLGCSAEMFNRNKDVTFSNLRKCLTGLEKFIESLNLGEIVKKIEFLDKIANCDIFWDRIKNIEKVKPKFQYVYDLVIENSHNFVANNIIVHNSHLAACLIEEILDRQDNIKPAIIVFDPHGEYIGFGDDVNYATKTKVYGKDKISIAASKISASLMNELIPQISSVQRRELSPIIKKLQDEKKAYDFEELIQAVENSEINPKTKAALASWLSDLASTELFGKVDSPSIEEVAKIGQLSVFDLSDFIHLKERQIILTYFARKLFDARRQGKIPPFIIFVEESHQFCPQEEEAASAISRNIIEQIAREGRKFGACLVLITQRPIRLATTALSQCNTHIIMRINNPYDIKHIGESSEGVTKDVLDMLPGLKVGEALITGEAVNYPLLVKIRERKSKKSEKGRKLEDEIAKFLEDESKKNEDLKAFR